MTARLIRADEWTGRLTPTGPPVARGPEVLPDDPTRVVPGAVCWHYLPRSMGAQPGDVLVVDETTHHLLDRCGPHHWAVVELRRAAYEADPEGAAKWLAAHEVWSARVTTRRDRRRWKRAPRER